MFPWGSIIGAGASLIGGVLSNRSNKKAVESTNNAQISMARETNAMQQGFFDENMDLQRDAMARTIYENDRAYRWGKVQRQDQYNFAKNSTRWQFDQLMRAADASGIHRLAALGGASGYQPVPTGGSGAPVTAGSPSSPVPATPDLQTALTGDIIGPAVAQLAEGYERQLQRERQNARDNEAKRIADAEIENLRAQTELTKARSRTILSQARKNDEPVVQYGTPRRSEAPTKIGFIPQAKPAPRTPVYVGGTKLAQDPTSSNVDAWSERYGEPGEWAGAAVVGHRDFVQSEFWKSVKEAFPDEVPPEVKKVWREIKKSFKKEKPKKQKRRQYPITRSPMAR